MTDHTEPTVAQADQRPPVLYPEHLHRALIRGHLTPVESTYWRLPRDDDGYPIVPEDASAELLAFVLEHGLPLPGQNRVSVPAGSPLQDVTRWLDGSKNCRSVHLSALGGGATLVVALDGHDTVIRHTSATTDLAVWSLAQAIATWENNKSKPNA